MCFFVYIVECSDGTYYSGWTTDLDRRLREHNHCKRGARYTRTRRPVILRHHEECGCRSEALRREAAIKSLPRLAKEALWKCGDSSGDRLAPRETHHDNMMTT